MTLRTFAFYAFAAVNVSVALGGCSTTPGLPQTANGAALRSRDTAGAPAASVTLTPIVAPTSLFPTENYTGPTGIRTQYMSATVSLNSGKTAGAMYDRNAGTWTAVTYPYADSTAAYGPESISGGYRVVGSYKNPGEKTDNGFVYDTVSNVWTPIIAPTYLCAPRKCNFTIAHSVFQNGSNYLVVGNYDAATQPPAGVKGHAFIYDSAQGSFAPIDIPRSISSTAYGIWIDKKTIAIAGGYADKKGQHAYVRDLMGKHLLTYDYPSAAITHYEGITGAGGPGNYNVAGDFIQPGSKAGFGFFQQIRDWKPCKPFIIGQLSANSVSQRTVIGIFQTTGGAISGYSTTIPAKYRCR
jgi:hypothetical protein